MLRQGSFKRVYFTRGRDSLGSCGCTWYLVTVGSWSLDNAVPLPYDNLEVGWKIFGDLFFQVEFQNNHSAIFSEPEVLIHVFLGGGRWRSWMLPWVFSKKQLDQRRNPTSSFDAWGCYASHRLEKAWFGTLRTTTFWGKSVEFSVEGTKDLVEKKENSEYWGLTRI